VVNVGFFVVVVRVGLFVVLVVVKVDFFVVVNVGSFTFVVTLVGFDVPNDLIIVRVGCVTSRVGSLVMTLRVCVGTRVMVRVGAGVTRGVPAFFLSCRATRIVVTPAFFDDGADCPPPAGPLVSLSASPSRLPMPQSRCS